MNVLTLDIGGTNPRMAMVNVGRSMKIVIQHKFAKDANLIDEINSFLGRCAQEGYETHVCCAAVAGPVVNNSCLNPTNACLNPTNAFFSVDSEQIINQTLLKEVYVINDFEAIAHGVVSDSIGVKSIVDKSVKSSSKAVIGPGTGLGVAYIKDQLVFASEGGHAGVSQIDILKDIIEQISLTKKCSQLGYEALVSGQGIQNIFLAIRELKNQSKLLESISVDISESVSDDEITSVLENTSDVARLVSENSLKNITCHLSMRLFFMMLGYASQSVALNGLASGGVYIAGGVVPKNSSYFSYPEFRQAFTDNWKENISDFLDNVPVLLVEDYDVSYYGCAQFVLSNAVEKN